MATTRIQRKSKRNRLKAAQRRSRLQQLLSKPVIKKVSADLDKGNI